MNFVKVQLLYLIWLMPLLFVLIMLGMQRRRRILSRFSSHHGLRSIAPRVCERRRWIKSGLLLAAVSMLVVALAGPRYGYRWQEIERKGVDIILALDCSRSMLAKDILPSRVDRAKREVYDLLTLLRGDRIGLVAFAGTAFLQCPLTIDYDAFYLFLNALAPDFLPVGGTDLAQAILTASDAFDKQAHTEKAIILITDGENTGSGDPLAAAQIARQSGIKIFSIGMGLTAGVPVPDLKGGFQKDRSGKIVLTRLDEALLQQVAADTGGAYVRSVAGDMDLDVIYRQEIRGKMEAVELNSGRKKIWQDRFQWPLLAAAILLLVELLIPSARKLAVMAPLIIIFAFNPPALAGPWQEGMQAYREENYAQALQHFLQAQIDDPQNPQILYNLGNAYYRLGEFNVAREHFQRAQATEQKHLKQQALYNAGNASYRNGMLQDAVRHYTDALKIDPEDRLARENLSFVKARLAQQPQSGDGENKDQPERQQQAGEHPGEAEKRPNPSGPSGPQQQGIDSRQSEQTSGPQSPADRSQQGQGRPDKSRTQLQNNANPQHDPPMTAGRQDGRADNRDTAQAESILNRLNDQPGRALMPAYDKKSVEKDW